MEAALNSQDNTRQRTLPPPPKPSHESFFFCETEIMAFSKGLTFIRGKRERHAELCTNRNGFDFSFFL